MVFLSWVKARGFSILGKGPCFSILGESPMYFPILGVVRVLFLYYFYRGNSLPPSTKGGDFFSEIFGNFFFIFYFFQKILKILKKKFQKISEKNPPPLVEGDSL